MLDDHTMEKLVPEVYSRLTMTDDEFDFEITVPTRNGLLGIRGGAKQIHFSLIAIVISTDGSRREVGRKIFHHVPCGKVIVAGAEVPNVRVQSVDEPVVEMWNWLKSDPWSTQ